MANSKVNAASTEVRTISVDIIDSVMKYAQKDSFVLSGAVLNKLYTTIDVDVFDVGEHKSFSVTLQDEQGNIIILSASAIKNGRMLNSVVATPTKTFKDEKDIFSRSDAMEMWAHSTYMHKNIGMRKNEEFIIPEQFRLRYAILKEDATTGKPLYNPFLYKYFREILEVSKKYPNMSTFKMELLKTKEEGRHAFLPKSMLEPELFAWAKGEVRDFQHTLIFQPVA